MRPPQSFTTQITSLFRAYRFELDNVVPATDNVDILLQVSTDGGSTWKATNYLDQVNSVSNNTVGGRAQLTTSIPLNGAAMSNTTALGGLSGTVTVINPAGTSHNKMILLQTTCVRQGGTLIEPITDRANTPAHRLPWTQFVSLPVRGIWRAARSPCTG